MASTTDTTTTGISDSDFAEAAAKPSSFTLGELSQSNHPLSELIAADKYLRKRALASRSNVHPLCGLVSHLVPPGTCDR